MSMRGAEDIAAFGEASTTGLSGGIDGSAGLGLLMPSTTRHGPLK